MEIVIAELSQGPVKMVAQKCSNYVYNVLSESVRCPISEVRRQSSGGAR